jgi:hypothetical protein
LFANIVSGFASGLVIPSLNYLNKMSAVWTTKWQNLREDSAHEANLFFKLFVFQFFNRFNSVLWIAFVKQDMEKLQVQVAILLFTPALLDNVTAVLLPLLFYTKQARRQAQSGEMITINHGPRVEYVHEGTLHGGDIGRALSQMSQQLLCSDNGVFDVINELIELAVQFGLVTMFITACPLAPVVALGTLSVNERIDALKLTWLQRAPDPRMVVGIGMPFYAIQATCFVALIVNCALLVFCRFPVKGGENSDYWPQNHDIGKTNQLPAPGMNFVATLDLLFPKMDGSPKMMVVFAAENLILLLMVLVSMSVAPVSPETMQEAYRQRYFENRQDAMDAEDDEDQGQVSAMRCRKRRQNEATSNPEQTTFNTVATAAKLARSLANPLGKHNGGDGKGQGLEPGEAAVEAPHEE